jgi:hypothetical protein
MSFKAAITLLGHRYTMYVEPGLGRPSRFHDPNGRVVATATMNTEWDGLIELDAFQYGFTISDDDSYVGDRMGRRASATTADGITLITSTTNRRTQRYELCATGPDRFGLYRRDHNVAVLNHTRIGNRVVMIGETVSAQEKTRSALTEIRGWCSRFLVDGARLSVGVGGGDLESVVLA